MVGLTPQIDQLNVLGEEIRENNEAAQFHAVQCDIGSEEEIQSAMDYVCGEFGGVDLLINNPAILSSKLFLEEEGMHQAESMIKTNILGVMSITKKAYKSMIERDVSGYIINVSCTIAESEIDHFSLNSVYAASKASVDTFSTCLGRELCVLVQPKVRVSNIVPINVKKDLLENSSTEAESEEDPLEELSICPKDVADTVMYCLSTPAHVQIKDIHLGSVGGSF